VVQPLALNGPDQSHQASAVAGHMITSPRRMEMMNDEGIQLRQELLKMDLDLRRKQDIWEHPRNIRILVGATAAIVGVVAGVLGFKIGQTPLPPGPPIIINIPPQK
jgi:hypothetical protein